MTTKTEKELKPLSGEEIKFVNHYLTHFSVSKAYLEATGNNSRLYQNGRSMINRPNVARFIENVLQERHAANLPTVKDIVNELANVAFYDASIAAKIKKIDDLNNLSVSERKAVSHVTYAKNGEIVVHFHSKVAALNTLAKHLGMIGPDINVNVNIGDELLSRIQRSKEKMMQVVSD